MNAQHISRNISIILRNRTKICTPAELWPTGFAFPNLDPNIPMAGSPISNSTRILDANLFYGRLDIVRPHLMRRAFFLSKKLSVLLD